MPPSQSSASLRLIGVAIAVAGVAVLAYLATRPKEGPPPASPSAVGSAPHSLIPRVPETLPPLVAPALSQAPAAPTDAVELDLNSPVPKGVVRVKSDQVLARVGGKPITLADVSPEGTGGVVEVPREELAARLDRAIERQVTFDAALAAGLDPEAETAQQASRIKAQQDEAAQRIAAMGATRSHMTERAMALEAKDLATITLQQKLLSKRGVSSATPSEDEVMSYFNAQRGSYPEIKGEVTKGDAAWEDLQKRVRADLRKSQQESMSKMNAELRAQAKVETPPLP